MPELPEVETIRRDLHRRVINNKIAKVLVKDNKISSLVFLVGKKFNKIERRGKLLAFGVGEKYLLVHLKMTGQLIYLSSSRTRGSALVKSQIPVSTGMTVTAGGHKLTSKDLQVPNKFTRVIFTFADKSQLFFNDMRRFGYLKIVDTQEKERIWRDDFGIEPLTPDYKFKDFSALFKNRKTNIKALIMNQKLISGVGNIYADEACWCAQLLPWRRASELKPEELKKLFSCVSQVLKVAIKNRGTSFSDFVDAQGGKGGHYNFLNVYERDGEKCRRCKNIIKKTRHAGRGTHYCTGCQK